MEINKTFFKGRLNKDFDERFVPEGEYTDALNIRVNSSESESAGVVNNIKGNTKLTTLKYNNVALSSDAKCIGSYEDGARDTIYWFITAPTDSVDMVVSFNVKTEILIYHVVSATVLNFSEKNLITGISLIDDLLFWTDNLNPPRRININSSYNSVTEDDISVIVAPPLDAPTIELFKTINEENYIEDKFISFSYRYKYKDGEHSALSQFTDVAFSPGVFRVDFSNFGNVGMKNSFNSVKLSFSTGGKNVVGVDLCFKVSGSNIVNVIERYDKEKEGWPDNTTEHINFSNKKIYTTLTQDELLRLYDNVPLKAKAQTVLGNRIFYGNYTDGYDIKDVNGNNIKLDYGLELVSSDVGLENISITESAGVNYTLDSSVSVLDSTINIDLTGISLVAGSLLSIDVDFNHDSFSGDAGYTQNSTGFEYNFIFNLQKDYFNAYALATSQEFIDAVSTHQAISSCTDGNSLTDAFNCSIAPQAGWTKVGSGITSGTGEFSITSTPSSNIITIQVPAMKYEDDANPGTYAYEYFKSGVTTSIFVEIASRESLHSNRDYEIGVVYMDDYNRSSTTLVGKKNTVFIPAINSITKNHIKATLRNDPPSWAKSYKFVIKPNQHKYETIYSNIYYNEEKTNSTWFRINGSTQSSIKAGDNLIVKSDSGGYLDKVVKTKVISVKVQEEDFIYGNKSESGSDIVEGTGFYIELKPKDFSATFIENHYINYGQVYNKSNKKYAHIFYSCNTKDSSGTNETPYNLPAGSEVRFIFSEKRYGSGSRCGSRYYKFNKSFIASKDYDNLHEMVIGDGIDFTIPSEIGGTDDDVTNKVYSLNFNSALGTSISQIPATQGTIQAQFQQDPTSSSMFFVLTGGTKKCNGRPGHLRCEIEVTRASNMMVFETEPIDADNGIFYESSKNYKIENNLHKGSSQDQTSSLPAVVDLNFFNCFTFGNGVESRKIEDDIVGAEFSLGSRVSAVSQEEYKEANRYADITYSGVYNEESNLNNLNEFNLSLVNYRTLDKSFGAIEKMHGRKTDIIVFQEDKISYVLGGKNLLSDAQGGGAITSTPTVLGTQVARIEDYGISNNPEGFASFGSEVFFPDAKRGVILNLSGGYAKSDQLQVISNIGMKTYFRDMFNESSSIQVIGGYDVYNNEYILSNSGVEQPIKETEYTCGYSVSQENSSIQNVIDVDFGSDTGTANFSYNVTSGSLTVTVDYNGSQVINSSVSGSGVLSFSKDSATVKKATVTLSPTNSTYNFSSDCIETDTLSIVRVIITSKNTFANKTHVKHNWSKSGYESPVREDFVLFETDGVSMYNTSTGTESTGYIPEENGVVKMSSNKEHGDDFIFDLSNDSFGYLLSDTLYGADDTDTLLSLLTDVAPITNPSTGVYEGIFNYTNPTDKTYLYLVWDYRDYAQINLCYSVSDINAICCTCVPSESYYIDSSEFSEATAVYGDVNLTSKALDGYYADGGYYREQLNGVLLNHLVCPSCLSTPFSSSLIDSSPSTICSQAITETYYHDGTGAYPLLNDYVYSDSTLTTPLASGYYKVSTNAYIEVIGALGLVSSKGNCGACYTYTLTNDGGSGDIVFIYTRCDGAVLNPTVGIGASIDVCAQSIDTVPPGGTVTGGTVTCT